MEDIKKELIAFCWKSIEEKANQLQKRSKALQESLNSETKSSAGDKHETGRAMVQLEQEKLGSQLVELEKVKVILQKVDISKKSSKITLGNLVKTTNGNYFISASLGIYKSKDATVFCISAVAPIARLLLGKSQGEHFVFNGKDIKILEAS